MKKIIVYFIFICCNLMSGCIGLSHRQVIGSYFLVSMNGDKDQTSLSIAVGTNKESFVGVIDDMVYAVGFNERYIIAKQHPVQSATGEADFGISNYYIVDMLGRNEYSGNKNVYGPFSEKEFELKKKQMGVPSSIDFSITIE